MNDFIHLNPSEPAPIAFVNEIVDPIYTQRIIASDAHPRDADSRIFTVTVFTLQGDELLQPIPSSETTWCIARHEDRILQMEKLLGRQAVWGELPDWVRDEMIAEDPAF